MNKKYYEILKINTYINNHKNEFNKEIGIMIKEWRTKRNISLEEMYERVMSRSRGKRSSA